MTFVRRLLTLSLIWVALVAGDPGSWWIGAPAVFLAALISCYLSPRSHIRLRPLLQFLPVFLLKSLLAGLDVARRAMLPRLAIEPALVAHDLQLPAGLARVVFMNTVSLLPGTLSADLDGNRLTIHVLDGTRDHSREIADLERTLAGIFQSPHHG